MTPTRRPQESFWLPAYKLKPQRGTMLLLAVEKGCFHGICSLSLRMKELLRVISKKRRESAFARFGSDKLLIVDC